MDFEIDNQTMNDLNIFPKGKNQSSVFDIFKKTITSGGQNALIQIMKKPSNDINLLTSRVEAIRYFQENDIKFDFTEKNLDFIQHYLNLNVNILEPGWFIAFMDWLSYTIKPTNEYFAIKRGVQYISKFLKILKSFIDVIEATNYPTYFKQLINIFDDCMQKDFYQNLLNRKEIKGKSQFLNYYDHIIRKHEIETINKLLSCVYEIDALIVVANVSIENGFVLPNFKKEEGFQIKIWDIFHPFVKNPITNNIEFAENTNMCFLTGANMAGKSTFLKSVGLCCYLAHLGFPVPASKMETGIFNGLISTINLADDMSKGYSHFYSEVKRVKKAAIKIKENERVLVIFDELFRGTNVKDAYDASLLITSAFAKINQSVFFISTHIVEIAEQLKSYPNILFNFFESDVVEENPIYSFKLKNGISEERHGLRIVKNEKIVEILENYLQDKNLNN